MQHPIYADNLVRSRDVIKTCVCRYGIQLFEHFSFHLSVNLFRSFAYLAIYVFIVALELLLKAIITELKCSGEMSILQLQTCTLYGPLLCFSTSWSSVCRLWPYVEQDKDWAW